MRKIHPNKVKLAVCRDSVTGVKSKSAFVGTPTHQFWITPVSLGKPQEVFVLDAGEVPEPKEGWAYAYGWIG